MSIELFKGVFFDFGLSLLGCLIGLMAKGETMKRIGERILQTFALLVIAMGISSAIEMDNTYLILASIVIGVALGEIFDFDGRISAFGKKIENKLETTRFRGEVSRAFSQSTMLLCVGSMTLMGSIQSGLTGTHTILFTKAVLDCITGITLAMGMGVGVVFSVVPLLIYEGTLVLMAKWVSPLMDSEILNSFNVIGGLLLIGVGLNIVKASDIKVANLIPAMFVPIFYSAMVYFLNV